MSQPGRPSPPFYVWFTLAIGLYIFVRGVQDIARQEITGWTGFRLAAAAYLAWSGISEWRKYLRRLAAAELLRSRKDDTGPPGSTSEE